MANLFRKGHRICIEITNLDLSTGVLGATNVEYIPYHVCSSRTVVHSIYHDAAHPSHLLLPIVPSAASRGKLAWTSISAGKRVLITGGSKGLGLAIGHRFAAEGCDLYLASRTKTVLEEAADAIRQQHPVKVEVLAIDLAKPGFAGRVVEACGDVDILVNNAGDVPSGSLETVDEARWRAGWDSKVFNYINLSREYFRRMKARVRCYRQCNGYRGRFAGCELYRRQRRQRRDGCLHKSARLDQPQVRCARRWRQSGPVRDRTFREARARQSPGAIWRPERWREGYEHAAVRPCRFA